MEASGHAGWFERLLAELNIELWMGDAAKIAAKRVRKQKTDRRDAQHILHLLLKDDFPKIWVGPQTLFCAKTVLDPGGC
jgi:transposase